MIEPDYPRIQADAIERTSGRGESSEYSEEDPFVPRENMTSGKLIRIDHPRFDPMWAPAGSCACPSKSMSRSDCFLPSHPRVLVVFGRDFPSNADARYRVIAGHSRTQFLVHVGNFAGTFDNVSENLDGFPNMTVDIAARIGEWGCQPLGSRRFLDGYQDRTLFGTDATPIAMHLRSGYSTISCYEIYYRFLETEDEYFDYSPAKVSPQGRWRIDGIGRPHAILEKVCNRNAARLLHSTG